MPSRKAFDSIARELLEFGQLNQKVSSRKSRVSSEKVEVFLVRGLGIEFWSCQVAWLCLVACSGAKRPNLCSLAAIGHFCGSMPDSRPWLCFRNKDMGLFVGNPFGIGLQGKTNVKLTIWGSKSQKRTPIARPYQQKTTPGNRVWGCFLWRSEELKLAISAPDTCLTWVSQHRDLLLSPRPPPKAKTETMWNELLAFVCTNQSANCNEDAGTSTTCRKFPH